MKTLLKRLSLEPEVHLILDFDGTLIPIRGTRNELRLPASTKAALASIKNCPVTILSGRKKDDLKDALGEFPFRLVSLNGLEESPELSMEGETIREHISGIISHPDVLGTEVEDKGILTSLHFRHLEKEEIGLLLAEKTADLLGHLGYSERWHVYQGKMVVNVEPKVASKAKFVSNYLASFPNALVLFAGDDTNDYPVFELDHPRLIKAFVRSPRLQPKPEWPRVTPLSREDLLYLLKKWGSSRS